VPNLSKLEALKLLARLAGLEVPGEDHDGGIVVQKITPPSAVRSGYQEFVWNPYDNRTQFDWLMEEAKISLDYDDERDEWVARRAARHVTWYKSRTEAGLQCAAMVELAKEGK